MKRLIAILAMAALGLTLVGCSPKSEAGKGATAGVKKEDFKIGFIVKSMSDSWFQDETKFAKEEGDRLGVEVVVQQALKGEDVISTMSTMATNGCKGIIICAPQVQLGTAIRDAAKQSGLKLMSVDDRLVDNKKTPLADVPHLGISAKDIGKQVGQGIADEMKKRGWDPATVGGIAITVPGLETAQQRVDGAAEVLLAAGVKKERIFTAPWTGSVDVKAASDTANDVLTTHSDIKNWVVFSSNDDGVLGGIRAIANRGIPTTNVIGVGINGSLAAAEWAKGQPTGLVASVLLQPKVHGGKTVEMMAKWIKDGTVPPMETYTTGVLINKDNYANELEAQGLKAPKAAK